jgi:hypothetical protein
VSRGLHDEEPRLTRVRVGLDDGVARLGQTLCDRRDLTARWVVAADGAVVGVAHRDGAVGQDGDAERVLEQRLRGITIAVAEVEKACADM